MANKFSNELYNEDGEASKKPEEDRLIVLCIAYHNIGVEQEFLK